MSQKALIVGIGGATCGGKSTLAKLLTKLWGPDSAHKFNQDDFYFPDDYQGHIFIPELKHVNWEVESAFDNLKLAKSIREFKFKSSGKNCDLAQVSDLIRSLEESLLTASEPEKVLQSSCQKLFERVSLPPVIVVEGIHVLTNKDLNQLCDLKVFLTLDYQTCLQRRLLRSYDPPDPPQYFDKIVWPSYLAHLPKDDKQVHFLDGRKALSTNFVCLIKLLLAQIQE